jgi:hypothetical protein
MAIGGLRRIGLIAKQSLQPVFGIDVGRLNGIYFLMCAIFQRRRPILHAVDLRFPISFRSGDGGGECWLRFRLFVARDDDALQYLQAARRRSPQASLQRFEPPVCVDPPEAVLEGGLLEALAAAALRSTSTLRSRRCWAATMPSKSWISIAIRSGSPSGGGSISFRSGVRRFAVAAPCTAA